MVHQNAPDDLRAECQKVYAAFTADTPRTNQLEVSLIGQSGRLKGVARLAPPQLLPGDSPQFRVNQRHQTTERVFVSLAPRVD
jgi:hypothetical protein